MKILIDNDKYQLCAEAGCDYNYIVWYKAPGFKQEVARSWNLTKHVTAWFNDNEIRKARAMIHAIKYVNRKFK